MNGIHTGFMIISRMCGAADRREREFGDLPVGGRYSILHVGDELEDPETGPQDVFTDTYLNTASAMTLQYETGIEYQVPEKVLYPDSAAVKVQVNYNTNLFGTMTREVPLSFVKEGSDWHLKWDVAAVMPDLQNGNKLEIIRDIPARGNIYANDGSPIAAQEDIVAGRVVDAADLFNHE